jgi:hypothetical protein
MGFPRKALVVASVFGIGALALLSRPAATVRAADTASPPPATDSQTIFQDKVVPILVENCYECHGNGNHKGDLALDSFKTIDDVKQHKDQWSDVLKDVQSGDMPVAAAKHHPSFAERKTITEWIGRVLYNVDPSHPYPGRVTLHRLNRSEYNNTIRDLLAMDFRPADAFPADDAGYGFDNNGDVLSIAPLLMEKYITAAGLIMDKAIFADPVVPPPTGHWDAAELEGTIPKSDPKAGQTDVGAFARRSMPFGRVFNYRGEIYTDYDFPRDGEYRLLVRGYGGGRPMVQFKIDGVNAGQPFAITEAIADTSVFGPKPLKVTAGHHRITVAFTNGGTKEQYDAAVAAAAAPATQPGNPNATPAPGRGAPAVIPPQNIDDVDPAAADPAANPPARPQRQARPPAPAPNAVDDGAGGAEDPAIGAAAAPAPAANGAATPAGGTPIAVTPGAGPATLPATNPALGRGAAAGRAGARGAAAAARGRGAAARGARGRGGGGPSAGPTLGVVFIEAVGPLEITPDRMPESYRRVFVSYPSATVTKTEAAEKIIRNFATKAFRRPATDDQVKNLMDVWTKQDATGETFEASIDTTLQVVLASPHFLYRYERDPGPQDADGVRLLDEYELASRLSYFFWSSMPDDELIKLAGEGKLRANLESQVKRMMADPKSMAMVENFAGQWLNLRKMNEVNPDTTRYPAFDEDLRAAMIKETQLYFSAIMQEDRSLIDFIDSDFTFMNARLAKHYGRTDITGDDFRRVALTGTQRGGLITQASILTITSYSIRTSPVQRGKWVLENLLDSAPPPPPPDVPKLVETSQAESSGTLRQRMEQHRTNPNCFACHSQMDPIGFGLENYDGIGAWRDVDVNNQPIDSSGTFPDGSAFNGAAGLRDYLKARKDQFVRCLTDRMLTYALGRGTEPYDRPLEDQIAAGVKAKDYKFSSLIMQIVESDAFQKRGAQRGEQ